MALQPYSPAHSGKGRPKALTASRAGRSDGGAAAVGGSLASSEASTTVGAPAPSGRGQQERQGAGCADAGERAAKGEAPATLGAPGTFALRLDALTQSRRSGEVSGAECRDRVPLAVELGAETRLARDPLLEPSPPTAGERAVGERRELRVLGIVGTGHRNRSSLRMTCDHPRLFPGMPANSTPSPKHA